MCLIISDEQFALQQKWVAKVKLPPVVWPNSRHNLVLNVPRKGRLRVTDNDKGHGISPPPKHRRLAAALRRRKSNTLIKWWKRHNIAPAQHNNAAYLVGIEAKVQTGGSDDVHQQVSNLDLICSLVLTLMTAQVLLKEKENKLEFCATLSVLLQCGLVCDFFVHLITSACGSNSDSLCQAF